LLESGKLREDSFQLVKVILDKLDAPLSVPNTGAVVGRFNEKWGNKHRWVETANFSASVITVEHHFPSYS
jgi:hypothetical protein